MWAGMRSEDTSKNSAYLLQLEIQLKNKKAQKGKAGLGARYKLWCEGEGQPKIVFSYDLVAGFISTYVMVHGGSSKSVDGVKSALKQLCEESKLPWLDGGDSRHLNRIIGIIKLNDKVNVRRVRPLQLAQLNVWTARWDVSDHKALMLLTLLYVGHDGLLRVGELLSGLTIGDVSWDGDHKGFSI